MEPNAVGNKGGSWVILDRKTLLPIDGSMIVGAFFFLTFTSFISFSSEGSIKFITGYASFIIIVPFIGAALALIPDSFRLLNAAKGLTIVGFIFMAMYLGLLLYFSYSNLFIDSTELQCAKYPEVFNVTYVWKCSDFSPGSLADQCVSDDKVNRGNIMRCSGFISPSDDPNTLN